MQQNKKINKVAKPNTEKLSLRLFVAGATDRSRLAVLQVRESCDAKLKGRYSLTVVDIYQQPKLAKEYQIVVTPTLIKNVPLPITRIIGDMANITSRLGFPNSLNQENFPI